MSGNGDDPEEALDAWSTYRDVSEKVHSEVHKALDAYAYLNSMATQNMGMTPQSMANAKRAILRIAKRLSYEVEMSRSKGELEEIHQRWSGEDGHLARLERLDMRADGEPEWLGELVDDIVTASWELGYTQSGRMEPQYQDEEQEDEAQVRQMFE